MSKTNQACPGKEVDEPLTLAPRKGRGKKGILSILGERSHLQIIIPIETSFINYKACQYFDVAKFPRPLIPSVIPSGYGKLDQGLVKEDATGSIAAAYTILFHPSFCPLPLHLLHVPCPEESLSYGSVQLYASCFAQT